MLFVLKALYLDSCRNNVWLIVKIWPILIISSFQMSRPQWAGHFLKKVIKKQVMIGKGYIMNS